MYCIYIWTHSLTWPGLFGALMDSATADFDQVCTFFISALRIEIHFPPKTTVFLGGTDRQPAPFPPIGNGLICFAPPPWPCTCSVRTTTSAPAVAGSVWTAKRLLNPHGKRPKVDNETSRLWNIYVVMWDQRACVWSGKRGIWAKMAPGSCSTQTSMQHIRRGSEAGPMRMTHRR